MTLSEVLKRSFQNLLDLWPLLLVRIAETVAMATIVIGGLFAIAAPFMIKAFTGGYRDLVEKPDDLLKFLAANSLTIIFVFAGFLVLLLLCTLLHAFVQAGVVGSYLEGERSVQRGRRPLFDPAVWMATARAHGIRTFWIYNIVWGTCAGILLVPLLAIIVLAALFRSGPVAIVVTCGGMLIVVPMMIVLSVIAFIWSQLAITIGVAENRPSVEAVREARSRYKRHTGMIIVLALLTIFASVAVSFMFGLLSALLGSLSSADSLAIALLPLRILTSLLQSCVSIMAGSWFIAAIAHIFVHGGVGSERPAPVATNTFL